MMLLRKLVDCLVSVLPSVWIDRAAQSALHGRHVALCLHRVLPETELTKSKISEVVLSEAKASELITRMERLRATSQFRSLFVTFDDGYQDAADFMCRAASQFPKITWIFFVCPRKILERTGFSWNSTAGTDDYLEPYFADKADIRLVTVDTCLEMTRLSNVFLGNHTNQHLNLAAIGGEESKREINESLADFAKAFGPNVHFAYPFGTIDVAVSESQIEFLRGKVEYQWSTDPRPFSDSEFAARDILPRFAIDGTISVNGMIAIMALRGWIAQFRTPRLLAKEV